MIHSRSPYSKWFLDLFFTGFYQQVEFLFCNPILEKDSGTFDVREWRIKEFRRDQILTQLTQNYEAQTHTVAQLRLTNTTVGSSGTEELTPRRSNVTGIGSQDWWMKNIWVDTRQTETRILSSYQSYLIISHQFFKGNIFWVKYRCTIVYLSEQRTSYQMIRGKFTCFWATALLLSLDHSSQTDVLGKSYFIFFLFTKALSIFCSECWIPSNVFTFFSLSTVCWTFTSHILTIQQILWLCKCLHWVHLIYFCPKNQSCS